MNRYNKKYEEEGDEKIGYSCLLKLCTLQHLVAVEHRFVSHICSEVSKFISIQKTLALHSPVVALLIKSYSIKKFYILSSQNKQRLFQYTSSTV
jgi:hypothetical protein